MKKNKIIKMLAVSSLILAFGACSTSKEKEASIEDQITKKNQLIDAMKIKQEAQQEALMYGNVVGFANMLKDISDNFNNVPTKYYGKGDGKKTRRGFAHLFSPTAVKSDKTIKEIQSGAVASYLSKNGKSNPLISSFTKQSVYDNNMPKSVNINKIKQRAIQVRDSISRDYAKSNSNDMKQLNDQIARLDSLQKEAQKQEISLANSTNNAPLKINYKDKK